MQIKHERPDWVKAFERPAGTEIKHIKGHWYLYEVSSHYDPRTKRSRKRSGRCLGAITEDGLVPSVSREERRRRTAERWEAQEAAPGPRVTGVVEVGASTLVWNLTQRHFPDSWREVYAVAAMRAIHEPALRRVSAHLCDSALWFPLGRPYLTPTSIASLLKEVGRNRDACCAYMREAISEGRRFLLFDGHRILTASRGCDLAELGYDSKMRHRPQINLVYAFSLGEDGAEPAYYKRYSGGTTDVAAYPDLLEEAKMWGKDCIAVSDKGFSSEDDFAKLVELGLSYVSPLKRNNRFAKGKIPDGPSGWDQAFTHDGRGICCITLPQDGFTVHVYLDTQLYCEEFSDVTARLEGKNDGIEARRAAELERRERGRGRLSDEQLAALSPVDVTGALGDRSEMGTITIRTNRTDLSAPAVYEIFKHRQAVEQFFKTYGDTLGMDATWMRSDEATEGLLFLNHLTATIANDVLSMIYEAGHSRDTSYRDCMEMCRKLRACHLSDGTWQAVPPIKKKLPFYEKLGVDPYDLTLLEMDPV